MRTELIEKMKLEIEKNLKNFVREEGIELYIAANDNAPSAQLPFIEIERMENNPLQGSALLTEIKIILGILGKPWQCEALIKGIYEALHPHHFTHRELAILLMSLNVETAHCVRPRCQKKRAIMIYVVEQIPVSQALEQNTPDIAKTECC